jgi:hypothetical protein
MADKTSVAPPSRLNSRKPLTDEERRARYEFLRRRSMLSPIYAIHRNPDWVVRWVFNGKIQSEITTHLHLGFEFATDDPTVEASERQIDTVVPISDDGFYRTGDVILMQIPKIDYDFYLSENVRQSRLMVDQGKEGFKEEAKRIKLPTGKRAFRTFDRDEVMDDRPQLHQD